MRPLDTEEPTHEEEVAAERLAEETKAQTARYVDYEAAIADGYVPDGPELGLQRHLKNPAYQKDGLILEPSKPELLVYATDGENQQLLGVAYTMKRAGDPGPQIGGPLTRWHSHNICFTLLPPSFGLVSPFGTCPLGAVAVTLPEMMHVWTVENPDGPYAENLDDQWVRELLRQSTVAESGEDGIAVQQVVIAGSDQLKYNPSILKLKTGQPVKIVFDNSEAKILHDFSIEEIHASDVHTEGGAAHNMTNRVDDGHAHTHDGEPSMAGFALHVAADAGSTASIEFTPEAPGEYTFYCTVEGHRQPVWKARSSSSRAVQ